jgi:putative intracellular protease/amidase
VESRLREAGADIEPGPSWTRKVEVDGNLITGQNPQSSVDTAQQVDIGGQRTSVLKVTVAR